MRLDHVRLKTIARSIPGKSREAQQRRMLAAMECGGVTKEDAAELLSIAQPYQIVMKLRDEGYAVQTVYRWDGNPNKTALYVLNKKGGAR